MDTKDSDKDFTFSIEGKEYTISEKNDTSKNNTTKNSKKQTLHVPSLTIGAIISGICIAIVVFGIGDLTESSSLIATKRKSPMDLALFKYRTCPVLRLVTLFLGSLILCN